jgi:hypothetical protein
MKIQVFSERREPSRIVCYCTVLISQELSSWCQIRRTVGGERHSCSKQVRCCPVKPEPRVLGGTPEIVDRGLRRGAAGLPLARSLPHPLKSSPWSSHRACTHPSPGSRLFRSCQSWERSDVKARPYAWTLYIHHGSHQTRRLARQRPLPQPHAQPPIHAAERGQPGAGKPAHQALVPFLLPRGHDRRAED